MVTQPKRNEWAYPDTGTPDAFDDSNPPGSVPAPPTWPPAPVPPEYVQMTSLAKPVASQLLPTGKVGVTPQDKPTAEVAAIITALQAAGVFKA